MLACIAQCFRVCVCVCVCVCVFSVLFSIVITSLGEERAGRAFDCLVCTRKFLSFFTSPWCQGLTAVCDSGTPWSFLFTFLNGYQMTLVRNTQFPEAFFLSITVKRSFL